MSVKSEPPLEVSPLVVTWMDSEGLHRHAVQGKAIVGTAVGADIAVSDPLVEPIHASIEVRRNGVWVRAAAESSEMLVDSCPVREAQVFAGSTLQIGKTELKFLRTETEAAGESSEREVWPENRFHQLMGGSIPMREMYATLARVAPTDVTVLVSGETGTGKDVVARSIHSASKRASGPFIIVDCAALPENLLDAELFGHAKGAFTGAVNTRAGAIEAANGGTVFLVLIGELPPSMQPKLLRVLEQRTIRRLGETLHRPVDVRFIFATHRDLRKMVEAGRFREDLYYRMAVVPIRVPALRDRSEDIPALIDHFIKLAGSAPFPEQTMKELLSRHWRGNVRELRNVVERMVALGTSSPLASAGASIMSAPSDFPPQRIAPPLQIPGPSTLPRPNLHEMPRGLGHGRESAPPVTRGTAFPEGLFDQNFKQFRDGLLEWGEQEYVRRLLERFPKNVSEAARNAGIDRTYIYRLMRGRKKGPTSTRGSAPEALSEIDIDDQAKGSHSAD